MLQHWRQALHLEPPDGWLNDPNGLCWFGGQYHVYFQYAPGTPDGTAPKCWGHYTSPDLLHWQYRGIPLRPDTPQDYGGVYSGCAVPNGDTLHLYYTGNVKERGSYDYITAGRQSNVLHTATRDGQRTGPKSCVLTNADYPGNCTLHVRDPKVWRDSEGWWMVLGARARPDVRIAKGDYGEVLLYRSADGLAWRFAGSMTTPRPFGYMWECPDWFPLGDQWVLSVSPQGLPHGELAWQNVYQSGWFAAPGPAAFLASPAPLAGAFTEWDHGFDFYAPQTFSAPDGRRLMLGWMGMPDAGYQNPTAQAPGGWQHCLSLPRELGLQNGTICQAPLRELLTLRGAPHGLSNGDTARIGLPFTLTAAPRSSFSVTLGGGLHVDWNAITELATLRFTSQALGGGRTIRRAPLDHCESVQMIVDRSSVEIYLNGGACVFSTRFYPLPGPLSVSLTGTAATWYRMNDMTFAL